MYRNREILTLSQIVQMTEIFLRGALFHSSLIVSDLEFMTLQSNSQEAKSEFCTFRVHAIYICICGITGKVKLFRL